MQFLKLKAKYLAKYFASIVSNEVKHKILGSSELQGQNAINQKLMQLLIKEVHTSGNIKVRFGDVGFRVYSQHEEDGILNYIFALIGTTNKRSIEICAGDGIECNTANLIINHKWLGLLVDGDENNISKAKSFYNRHPDTKYWPPRIVRAWITKNNVNRIIQYENFEGAIDLLSIDIDGNDLWIWDAINAIDPRVVVTEFNHLWGPYESKSTPYEDDFVAEFTEYGSDYAGASLAAFVKIGKSKGYRLIGTNAIATNAFFIKDNINHQALPEVLPENCFSHPRAIFGINHRFPKIKDRTWVDV